MKDYLDHSLPLFISFSGGETSALMTWYLKRKYPNRKTIVLFANTGEENEATLQFVDRCDKEWGLNVTWIEAVVNPQNGVGTHSKVVTFETASRNSEPYEDVIRKYGIPNAAYPHCNRELKTVPMTHHMRHTLGLKDYVTAIGIRADEVRRIKWHKAREKMLYYPLATEFPVNKAYVKAFWQVQSFRLGLEFGEIDGNCKTCWKKSKRKLLTLAKKKPHVFDFTKRMEEKYGMYTPEGRENPCPPYTFYRDNESTLDLLEQAQLPFTEWSPGGLQTLMFFEPELDSTEGCQESCEAF